jgi:hypothetical protein
MTEEPKRDWRKIKYYPVSMKKLERASMREAAYLIAPMNIGEDYEYFDKVKHLLIIPEKPKTLEEISQELDEKFEKLIESTKEKFAYSKESAEKGYNYKFDMIMENFAYAKEHGSFPQKVKWVLGTGTGISALDGSYLVSGGSDISTSFVIKQGGNEVGYYTFGNRRYFKYYMPEKPTAIVRFFMKNCLGFFWVDEVL